MALRLQISLQKLPIFPEIITEIIYTSTPYTNIMLSMKKEGALALKNTPAKFFKSAIGSREQCCRQQREIFT